MDKENNKWRDHSANYAKGEKCPATIETLQAAWDRDQELLLEQKSEISKLKKKLNQARQRPPAPDAELVELLGWMIDLAEYWINRTDKRGMSEREYNTWLALGHHSRAMQAARTMIATLRQVTA